MGISPIAMSAGDGALPELVPVAAAALDAFTGALGDDASLGAAALGRGRCLARLGRLVGAAGPQQVLARAPGHVLRAPLGAVAAAVARGARGARICHRQLAGPARRTEMPQPARGARRAPRRYLHPFRFCFIFV